MEIRKIQFQDFGPASKMLKKVDIRPFAKKFQSIEIKPSMSEEEKKVKEKESYELGIDLCMYLAENYHLIEDEATKLLAGWTGMKESEVKVLDLDQLKETLLLVVEKNGVEGLKNFFKKASGLMK